GFGSLFLMQTVVRQWRGVAIGWIFAGVALALGSVRIYLGRFLRLNSWDAVEHPTLLPPIAPAVARDPFTYTPPIGATPLFTLGVGFASCPRYNRAVVGRELEVERQCGAARSTPA